MNVSSNMTALGAKNLAVYAASKGGVHVLTRHLAVELAPLGIRVNTFAPGPTVVERNLADDPDYDATWGVVVPLGRAGAASEMIGPALFLVSSDSSYVTGQLFYADGGWSIAGRLPEAYLQKAAAGNGAGAAESVYDRCREASRRPSRGRRPRRGRLSTGLTRRFLAHTCELLERPLAIIPQDDGRDRAEAGDPGRA